MIKWLNFSLYTKLGHTDRPFSWYLPSSIPHRPPFWILLVEAAEGLSAVRRYGQGQVSGNKGCSHCPEPSLYWELLCSAVQMGEFFQCVGVGVIWLKSYALQHNPLNAGRPPCCVVKIVSSTRNSSCKPVLAQVQVPALGWGHGAPLGWFWQVTLWVSTSVTDGGAARGLAHGSESEAVPRFPGAGRTDTHSLVLCGAAGFCYQSVF